MADSTPEGRELHLLCLREVVYAQLRVAGFAIGQPRSEATTYEWAEKILQALQNTDPKYVKALLNEEGDRWR